MHDQIVFIVDCYSKTPFPCGKDGVSEYCLRNGKCPYACAIPSEIDKVTLCNISLAGIAWAKIQYWIDQVYYIIKWNLFPGSWGSEIDPDELKALENDPSFMVWAKITEIEEYQFYQWLESVREEEKKYKIDEDTEEISEEE